MQSPHSHTVNRKRLQDPHHRAPFELLIRRIGRRVQDYPHRGIRGAETARMFVFRHGSVVVLESFFFHTGDAGDGDGVDGEDVGLGGRAGVLDVEEGEFVRECGVRYRIFS